MARRSRTIIRKKRRRSVEREKLEDGGYIERRYDKEGRLASEIPYNRKKQIDGTATWYYPNGKPQRMIDFKNGQKDGILQEFYSNGTIKEIVEFALNVAKHYQRFTATGQKYDEGDYVAGRRQSTMGRSTQRSVSNPQRQSPSVVQTPSSNSSRFPSKNKPSPDKSGGKTPPRTTARQRTQQKTPPVPSPLYSKRRDLPRQGDYENYESYSVDQQGRRQGWSRTYRSYDGPERRVELIGTSAFYYRDGVRNGPYWMKQERNGTQVRISGSYKDGKKDGTFKVVDRKSGRVMEQGVYSAGKRVKHETYERDEVNRTNTNTKYEHDKPVFREVFQYGELKKREAFDNQGRVVSSENYENGEISGRTLHRYDAKGNRFSQTMDNDGNIIGAECYNEETKTLVRSSQMDKEGRPTEFEKITDGKADGKIQLSYAQDGTVSVKIYGADGKIQEEYAEKNGQRIGDFKTYDENGNVVVEGSMDASGKGSRTTWNKDGSQLTEEFENGKLYRVTLDKDGISHRRDFDEKGALVYEEKLDSNKRTSHSVFYEYGRKKSESFYDHTKHTSETKDYDVNGKIVSIGRSSGKIDSSEYKFVLTEYYDYEAGKVRSQLTATNKGDGCEKITYNEKGEVYSKKISRDGKTVKTQEFDVDPPTDIKDGWDELAQQQKAQEEAKKGNRTDSRSGGDGRSNDDNPSKNADQSRGDNGDNRSDANDRSNSDNRSGANSRSGSDGRSGTGERSVSEREGNEPTHRWRQKDGTVLEGRFTPDGKPDGTWVLKDSQGKVLHSEVYQGGKVRSFTKTDYQKGLVLSGEFDEKGRATGTWTEKDTQGRLRHQLRYSPRPDGGQDFEYMSSDMRMSGRYDAQGRPDGEWKKQVKVGKQYSGGFISPDGSEITAPHYKVFTKAEFKNGERGSSEMRIIDEKEKTLTRQNIRKNWLDSTWEKVGNVVIGGAAFPFEWGTMKYTQIAAVGPMTMLLKGARPSEMITILPKDKEKDFDVAIQNSEDLFKGNNPDQNIEWLRENPMGKGLADGARPTVEAEIRRGQEIQSQSDTQKSQEEKYRQSNSKTQDEISRREDDLRRKEEEQRRREEDIRRREEEQRRQEEQRRREGEQKKREEELRKREEALRKREEELRKREEALRKREEELRKREEALRKRETGKGIQEQEGLRREGSVEEKGVPKGKGNTPRAISKEDLRMNELRNNSKGSSSSGTTQVQQLMDMFKKRDEK